MPVWVEERSSMVRIVVEHDNAHGRPRLWQVRPASAIAPWPTTEPNLFPPGGAAPTRRAGGIMRPYTGASGLHQRP